ncbi:MAG: hypothetical protein IPP63_19440 [Chloracidobacterium sp.]|nr:hypothetical protein [Chloracidobacterium sp.]
MSTNGGRRRTRTLASTFKVKPNEQAKVEGFQIKIDGLTSPIPEKDLRLKKAARTRAERLMADVVKEREILRKIIFAPLLDEPRVTDDGDANRSP